MTTHKLPSEQHVAVIGAGLAGLAASYKLVKAGYTVTLFEASSTPGGLASAVNIQGHPVERFYHFICRMDLHLIRLAEELNLSNKLHWKKTRTSFYYNGKMYSFGTPFHLMWFSPIPWMERLRFGMHILYSRYRSVWKWLDQIPAKAWLIENIGEKAYEVIWQPLLKVKFDEYHDKISAAWVWHRIWRVAKSRRRLWESEVFGYFDEGSTTLVQGLTEWLCQQPNFELRLETPVQNIVIQDNQVRQVILDNGALNCDAVISTVALPQLSKILPDLEQPYFQEIKKIDYIGVVCALFVLKKSFSSSFWMNINDQSISYNGIIEETNLNQNWRKSGLNLLYIPYYISTKSPRYGYSDTQLYDEYIQSLRQINPNFDESWISEWYIFRAPYAQALCTINFAGMMPEVVTPVVGLYVSDSTQFYPEDRTLSAAVRQGQLAAEEVRKQLA